MVCVLVDDSLRVWLQNRGDGEMDFRVEMGDGYKGDRDRERERETALTFAYPQTGVSQIY